MKTIFLWVIFLGMTVTPAFSDTLFSEAETLYKSGHYKEAAERYEKAVSKEPSAMGFYNLGNADFRAGFKGKALLAYERALGLNPRDADIRWNLTVLKSSITDVAEDPDGNIFVSSVKRLLEWINIDEVAAVFTGTLGMIFILSLLGLGVPSARAWVRGFTAVLIFFWVVSGFVFFAKWMQIKEPRAVILVKEVSAHYGPSEKETKAFTLHEGAQVHIADETMEWYLVNFGVKNTGWIKKSACEII